MCNYLKCCAALLVCSQTINYETKCTFLEGESVFFYNQTFCHVISQSFLHFIKSAQHLKRYYSKTL